MIEITPSVRIDENELHFDFVQASGPGGQNVNKVATAVQLRFDVTNSATLTPEVKENLAHLAGSRMTGSGELLIEAKRYRTREQNRSDALQRLIVMLQKATHPAKKRSATRPSLSSREERLQVKRRRAATKKLRRQPPNEE